MAWSQACLALRCLELAGSINQGKAMNDKPGMNRRSLLAGAGLLCAGAWAAPVFAISEAELFPIATTRHGKIKGITWSGVHAFKGVPYGASTAGKNRWKAPQPPASWKGEKECFDYGMISPQVTTDRRSEYSSLIMWDRHVGGMGEDMLTLNVWSRVVKADGTKRPVFVSFHGGGYTTGSGNAPGFDGDPLVRYEDVVVVTVNHRLGALGYLNLVDAGASKEFADAGSVGLLDLVASLKWVQENIENFGGDPQRVFIFGQSGGGAKTSAVYSMPAAKGMFSRAAIQSGSALRGQARDASAQTTRALMKELGITKAERLVDVPWTKLLAAQQTVQGAFSPVMVEGTAFGRHPFDPDAPPASKDVPLIVSYTADDAALRLTNFNVDAAGVKEGLVKRYNAQAAERIFNAYRAEYPDISDYLINARIQTDSANARSVIRQLELKAAQGGADCYQYIWEWKSLGMDGKFGAVHGVDVQFSFHNPRGPLEGGAGMEARLMADRLGSAWVAFAKTGNPNNPALPEWPKWDADKRTAMIFDINTRAVSRPHSRLQEMWREVGNAQGEAASRGS
jgi:para-nitrobenzyl esterase